MTSLYVDRKGVELRVESDTLIFAEEGKRVACIPLQPLERVFLPGDVTLKASVLGRLGAKGIGVVVMSGRKGEATMLMPRPHNDAARWMARYKVAQDEAPAQERLGRSPRLCIARSGLPPSPWRTSTARRYRLDGVARGMVEQQPRSGRKE